MRCCLILCFEYYKASRVEILTVSLAFVFICFESMFNFRGAPAARRAAKRSHVAIGKETPEHIEIKNYTTLFSVINIASSVYRGRRRPTTKNDVHIYLTLDNHVTFN